MFPGLAQKPTDWSMPGTLGYQFHRTNTAAPSLSAGQLHVHIATLVHKKWLHSIQTLEVPKVTFATSNV